MAYPSRLLSQERLEASPRSAGDRGLDETIDWASIRDDLEGVRDTKANLLVVGPEHLVMKVIRRVIADVSATIVISCEAGRLPPSRLSLPSGSVVFRDVDALNADGQAVLFEWLETASAGRQVVSTASASLMPLVDAGVFDRELYYRLNTVFIRLGQ